LHNLSAIYTGKLQNSIIMIILWLYLQLATVCILATVAENQYKHIEADTSGTLEACGMEMIWPRDDAIILIGSDSRSVMMYMKLWGNCSEFWSPTRSHVRIGLIVTSFDGHDFNEDAKFEEISASPLDTDFTPIHFRQMRSPLLSQQFNESLPWATGGVHNSSQRFSIWSLALVYSDHMLNLKSTHDPATTYMTIELHLISDLRKTFPRVSKPSATLQFRLMGKPSSHLYLISPRYTSIPGFVCLSACGNICKDRDDIGGKRVYGNRVHDFLPTHSPVCARITQAVNWKMKGPPFTLNGTDGGYCSTNACVVLSPDIRGVSDAYPNEVAVVSIGGGASGEISVTGPGRHRLLSVIAAVLSDSVGFVLLKTRRARIDRARVMKLIKKFDLNSSNAVIAFQHRRIDAMHGVHTNGDESPSEVLLPLPAAVFGSINDGILLSRAAAQVMLMAAMDETGLHVEATLPAACSEYLIFSDAWLCWCAAELDIPALDVRLSLDVADDELGGGTCAASSPLYAALTLLYDQQRLSSYGQATPPFTERTTLGFQYFMQTLVFHLVSDPRILHIPDDEEHGDMLFWDACCSRLLVDHMLLADSLPANAGLHPVMRRMWGEIASVSSRRKFVECLRDALVLKDLDGRDVVNSKLSAVRRRLRLSVSAARVLGCSVQNSDSVPLADGDLLRGSAGSNGTDALPLQLHVITPAVRLMKYGRPVSRRLYMATHEEWSRVFEYNPLFSKDALHTFSAPQFSVQDWHLLCTLAVSSMKHSDVRAFHPHSREYLACNAFVSAVSQRTYAAGMPRCFDLPPSVAGAARFMGSAQEHAQYLMNCEAIVDDGLEAGDDPWMLRRLAGQVQALLIERWDLQQVCDVFVTHVLYCHVCFVVTTPVLPELVRGVSSPSQ